MSYKFKISLEDNYVYGIASGEDSYQTSLGIFTEIVKSCTEYGCYKVLVVSDMSPISIMEAYDHQNIFKVVGINLKYRIAWVDKNPESLRMNKFAETVLVNRGLVTGKVFSDVMLAKKWLLECKG